MSCQIPFQKISTVIQFTPDMQVLQGITKKVQASWIVQSGELLRAALLEERHARSTRSAAAPGGNWTINI